MDWLKIVQDGGIGVAVLAVVFRFVIYISKRDEADRLERAETQKVITNHLEHTTQAQRDSAEMNRAALKGIETAVSKLCDCIEKKN